MYPDTRDTGRSHVTHVGKRYTQEHTWKILNETFERREESTAVLYGRLAPSTGLSFHFSARTRLNLQATAIHVTIELHLNLHTWKCKFREI